MSVVCGGQTQPLAACPINHLEERLLDQAQAWASYTPSPFWGLFA